jgi:hypothetical protein
MRALTDYQRQDKLMEGSDTIDGNYAQIINTNIEKILGINRYALFRKLFYLNLFGTTLNIKFRVSKITQSRTRIRTLDPSNLSFKLSTRMG